MKQSSLFFINPLTILYLLLALIFNKFSFIIIHYSIAFIHEASHYLMARSLKIKVKEMDFLPIGFFIKINDLEEQNFIKQLLVLIAGPLSYFVSLGLLKLAYSMDLISFYGYQDGLISNRFILIFNLLPIYPLDGAKIVELFFTPLLNEYKLRILRVILSLLTIVLMSSVLISLGEIITMIFLFITTIISLINLKKDYLICLIKRFNRKNKMKVRINRKKEIYRLNDNYYYANSKILQEKEIIQEILSKEKLKDVI